MYLSTITLCAIVATIVFVSLIVFVVIKQFISDRNKEVRGIDLFGERIEESDFLAFINTCVSYLLIEDELDLNKFIDDYALRLQKDSTYIYLETMINQYPIIACTYVGNHKFVVDKTAMIEKYEKYQQETGNDDYVVPLFDNRLIAKYNFFNIQTRYQQIKIASNIMKINNRLGHDGTAKYDLSNDAQAIIELEKKFDLNKFVVKRRTNPQQKSQE